MPAKTIKKNNANKRKRAVKAARQRVITERHTAEPLTKRRLVSAVSGLTRAISAEAFRHRGYILTEEKGWVVEIDRNGHKKKIAKIIRVKRPGKIVLD